MNYININKDYKPSENEEYMNPTHLQYFKNKLLKWKRDLLTASQNTVNHLQEARANEPDPNDRATIEADTRIELRARDRDRKLIDKIDAALNRIEKKQYGYCEDTGQKIGVRRLEARPIATLSIEAQEKHEKYERTHVDDDHAEER